MPGVCLRYPRPVVTLEIETVGPAPLDPRAPQHMVPMRDGVRLATDVYLPEGAGPVPGGARAPAVRQERPLLLDAVPGHALHRARLRVRAAGRARQVPLRGRSAGIRRRGARRLRHDRVDRAPAVVERRRRHVGRQLLRLHAMGRGRGRAPRAQGDRPARHVRRHRRLARGRDAALRRRTTWAEYWTDHDTHEWTPDWSRRPLAEVFDEAFEALGRRSASFDYVLERSRGAERVPLFPGAHPFDVLRIPTLHGVGWFDNITPPHMLDYEALDAESRDGAVPVPARGLDRPRELPLRARADPRVGRPRHARRRARADAVALHRAGARLLRRVPDRRGRPGRRAARALAPPPRRLAGVAQLAAAGRGRAAPLPRRCRRAPRRRRPAARWCPAPGERRDVAWMHDPRDLVPSTLVDPFAALYEYPDERAVESRARRADVHDARLGRARDARRPRRRPPRASRATRPRCSCTSSSSTSTPTAAPTRCCSASRSCDEPAARSAGRGLPRPYGLPRRCPGHRLRLHVASSDFPVFLPHPGTAENPWDATDDAREPPDARDRRRDAVVRQPDRAALATMSLGHRRCL